MSERRDGTSLGPARLGSDPIYCAECGQHEQWWHLSSCSRVGRKVTAGDRRR